MNYYSGTIPTAPPTDVHRAIRCVSDEMNIPVCDVMPTGRTRGACRIAMYTAMYLMRVRCKMWLRDIANEFDRDHTTVMYAIKEVRALMAGDPAFKQQVEYLMKVCIL